MIQNNLRISNQINAVIAAIVLIFSIGLCFRCSRPVEVRPTDRIEKELLQLSRKIDYHPTLKDVAISFSKIGDLEQADRVANRISDDKTKAFVLSEIAQSIASIARRTGSEAFLNQAIRFTDKINFPEAKTSASREIALSWAYLGKTDKAVTFFEKAYKDASSLGHSHNKTSALEKLAESVAWLADTTKDVSFLDRAQIIAETISSEPEKSLALRIIVESAAKTACDINSTPFIEKAEQITNRITNYYDIACAQKAMALAWGKMRETDKAIMFLNQAQQSAEAIETDLAKFYVLNEIAITAADIGEMDEALALFDRVLQIAETMIRPQFFDNARAQNRVVASFVAMSLTSQDTVLLNRACKIAEMMAHGRSKAVAFKIIASAYLEFGKTDKASEFLEKAGKIVETLSDDELLSSFAAFAANMADSAKDTSFLDKAYIFTDAITSEYWKVSALRAIAVSLANLGKIDLAVDLLEQARLISETIAGSITSENTRALALSELAESAALLRDTTEVAKFLEGCRQSATQIYNDSYRVIALTAIATSAAKTGNWNQALDIANSNGSNTSKAESLSAILRVWGEYWAFDKKKGRRDTEPMRDVQNHEKDSAGDTATLAHRNISQHEHKSDSKNVHRVFLRTNPLILSEEEATSMIKQRGFFEVERNNEGRGLQHQYEEVTRQGEKLIIDHATHLTWQKVSSEKNFRFARAQEYIRELNTQKYAGYNDWRLPTLEEAMSLMEPQKSYMYINSLFFDTYSIWTADTYPYSPSEEWGWYVEFSKGLAVGDIGFSYPVRAVR